jgi:hypothetical protein
MYVGSCDFKLQSNSVITNTVITNSRLLQTKFIDIFGPKWLLYYITLHGYYEFTVIANKY